MSGEVGPGEARGDRRSEPKEGSEQEPSSRTLWHGRFAEGPSDALMDLSVSLPFDRRLAAEDIQGSRAHVASAASAPANTLRAMAASSTVCVNGPIWSRDDAKASSP